MKIVDIPGVFKHFIFLLFIIEGNPCSDPIVCEDGTTCEDGLCKATGEYQNMGIEAPKDSDTSEPSCLPKSQCHGFASCHGTDLTNLDNTANTINLVQNSMFFSLFSVGLPCESLCVNGSLCDTATTKLCLINGTRQFTL